MGGVKQRVTVEVSIYSVKLPLKQHMNPLAENSVTDGVGLDRFFFFLFDLAVLHTKEVVFLLPPKQSGYFLQQFVKTAVRNTTDGDKAG